MNRNGLTFTVVMEAQSANYGEGIGNISQLKKMTKGSGEVYTYISRQAIRYNIISQMGCDNTPVENKGVVQFAPAATIEDYPEIDLFGYMKTTSKESGKGEGSTRSAVVRLSNAISLEPYNSDLDFLTNMGMAKRSDLQNSIAQSEIHNSLYTYTVTIDLDKVGIDINDGIEIGSEEKCKRVIDLLDAIQFLYRDIKGRRENLSPILVVGGIYERKNPYFEGRIELNKGGLNVEMVKNVINQSEDTINNTSVGFLNGKFKNEKEIKEILNPIQVNEFFDVLKKGVSEYYA